MSTRKYRLLKDVMYPTCEIKKGTVGYVEGDYVIFPEKSGGVFRFHLSYMENRKEWFAEEPETPARIGVQFFPCGTDALNGMFVHSVAIGKQITREEAPALERAIEEVVNGDEEAWWRKHWAEQFRNATNQEPKIITTNIPSDGKQYKVCVGGVEWGPKGFWTDELVERLLSYVLTGVLRVGAPEFIPQTVQQFKKMESGEQSKQGGGL